MLRAFTVAAMISTSSMAFPPGDPQVLRIGMTGSLMEDVPSSQREKFAGEFTSLVHDFTGLKSVNLMGLDPWTSAKQLEANKWDVGVFQGVEFAWVKAKFPKLQPFMIATQAVPLKAVLVVRQDDKAAGFADLKGKNVVILHTKLHCRLFAEKGVGGKPNQFFGKLTQNRSYEDALDAVLLDKAQGAIVDTVALDTYKDLAPGKFKRLKIVAESELFPPAVIVYERGALDDKLRKTLTDGMLKANQNDRGRETLNAFHVTGFAAVPADYERELSAILKSFPAQQQP